MRTVINGVLTVVKGKVLGPARKKHNCNTGQVFEPVMVIWLFRGEKITMYSPIFQSKKFC